MQNHNQKSEWEKPLTKGDFRLHNLNKELGIYLAVSYFFGACGLTALLVASFQLFTGSTRSSIYLFLASILGFWVTRQYYKEWRETRKQIQEIKKEIEKREEQ